MRRWPQPPRGEEPAVGATGLSFGPGASRSVLARRRLVPLRHSPEPEPSARACRGPGAVSKPWGPLLADLAPGLETASVAWKSGHGALSLGGFPGARSWRALSLASHSLARERPAGRGEGPRAGPGAAGEAEAPTSQAPATRGLGHKKGASGHWVSASPAPHLLGRILGKPGPWDLGKALRRQFGQTPAGPPSCFRDAATRWRAIPDRVRRRSEGPTETKLNGSLVWKP